MNTIVPHKILIILLFLSGITFGCQSTVKYDHMYRPYLNLGLPEVDFYNEVFNYVRDQLVYIVTNTYPSGGPFIGLTLELGSTGGWANQFNDIVNLPPVLGWMIYMEEIIPLSDNELKSIREGQPIEDLKNKPTARYFIKLSPIKGTVYCRYIIPNGKNYDFIYTLEKRLGKWTLVEAKQVN